MGSYYVVERIYVGPKDVKNRDLVFIQDHPATTNQSHKEQLQGWCGTTSDVAVYAHGKFGSFDAAEAAVEKNFGKVRSIEVSEHEEDNGILAAYEPGRYDFFDLEQLEEWAWYSLESVKATTTNEELQEMIDELRGSAQDDGFDFEDDDFLSLAYQRRDNAAQEDLA